MAIKSSSCYFYSQCTPLMSQKIVQYMDFKKGPNLCYLHFPNELRLCDFSKATKSNISTEIACCLFKVLLAQISVKNHHISQTHYQSDSWPTSGKAFNHANKFQQVDVKILSDHLF